MTVAPPVEPVLPPRRRPWGILVLVAIALAVVAYLAFSGIGSALVYYVTPTELLRHRTIHGVEQCGWGAWWRTVRWNEVMRASSSSS